MNGPDPSNKHPMAGFPQVCFIKNTVTREGWNGAPWIVKPEIAERFRIDHVPTLLVVADRRVQDRLVHPRGCKDIETMLRPWMH